MKRMSIVLLCIVLGLVSAAGSARAADCDPELPADQDRVTIPVAGMSCGSCVSAIERSVRKLEGILDVTVDHLEGEVTVIRMTEKVTVDQIVVAINETGYKASRPKQADR